MATASIADLRRALEAAADPVKAPPMAAYMKHRFAFLGVAAAPRRAAQRSFLAESATWPSTRVLDAAVDCWSEPEREFQYVACDLLVRRVRVLASSDLDRIEALIRSKSWWDTVDALASNVVGPMVAADPGLAVTIDRWIDDDDVWIARSALLHQLEYRERTDADRLFAYVDHRCEEPEFFLRKGAGWALREYSKTDPEAVRRDVAARGERLSGSTRREALKHIDA